MTKTKRLAECDDNSCYTDGFPINDNPEKIDEIHSRDPSRPFDSGRSKDKTTERKNTHYSGTTLNEPDKYKK